MSRNERSVDFKNFPEVQAKHLLFDTVCDARQWYLYSTSVAKEVTDTHGDKNEEVRKLFNFTMKLKQAVNTYVISYNELFGKVRELESIKDNANKDLLSAEYKLLHRGHTKGWWKDIARTAERNLLQTETKLDALISSGFNEVSALIDSIKLQLESGELGKIHWKRVSEQKKQETKKLLEEAERTRQKREAERIAQEKWIADAPLREAEARAREADSRAREAEARAREAEAKLNIVTGALRSYVRNAPQHDSRVDSAPKQKVVVTKACGTCEGRGTVVAADFFSRTGERKTCPKCGGRGSIDEIREV